MSPLGTLLTDLYRPPMGIALIVASAMFMQNLDSTIIVTALPAMAKSFATNATRVSEGITAYALAAAVCIPASSWLAERVGTRNLFAAAIALFTLSSMACGLTSGFGAFIAARLMQGGSAAMMTPVGRLIVLHNTRQHELMRILSALVWPGLLAPVIGPALGGFITSALSWRWIFYVNLPFGIAAIALVLTRIPNQKTEELASFDGAGFLLSALAVGCLTYGLDMMAGRTLDVRLALSMFAAGTAAGYAAIRHLGSASTPLVRLDVLRRHDFFIATISGGGVSRAAINATPFLLPLLLEVGYGYSPLKAGMLLVLYMLANLLTKAVANPVIRRFGLRRVLTTNSVIVGAGIAACALLVPGLSPLLTVLILLFAGGSRSMHFTAMLLSTFAETSPEERSSANVLLSLTQQVSMAIGVAISALILNFSRLLRRSVTLSPFDIRLTLVLMGCLGTLAAIAYSRLDERTGEELTQSVRKPG